jgi:hypothetical protein
MRDFTATGSAHTSWPTIRTEPSSGRSSPVTIDSVVVFPAPFGPTRPMNRPDGRSRSMPATAACSPNRFHSPRTRTAGGSPSAPPSPPPAWSACTAARP